MTKRIIALMLVVMMFFTIPAFGATVVTGTNQNTIYISFAYKNADEEVVTSIAKGEEFTINIHFSNNPSVVEDSIQSFDMLIGYDARKISVDDYWGDAVDPTVNLEFTEGTVAAAWAKETGIKKGKNILTEGKLFVISATALENLSENDLNGITILSSVGEKKTAMIDGNDGFFTIVQLPGIEVGTVSGDIYTDTTAPQIKEMISSVSYIDASNNKTTYTSADAKWANLSVSLPVGGLVVGENILTATFDGYKCDFEVEVKDRVNSIAITTAPTKTTYNAFETFDKTGMVVTATYDSGNTEDVTNDATISKTTALLVSDKEITVTYEGKTATQAITVNPKEIVKPVAKTDTLTYSATEQTFEYSVAVDTDYVTITGNSKGTDAGIYNATAKLKDDVNTIWEDGTKADVSFSWEIEKADITAGMAGFSKRYTATYSELLTSAALTGVNSEVVNVDISWYADADCTAPAVPTDAIASSYSTAPAVLYYKATGMNNYNDYKGQVNVTLLDKEVADIEWTTKPEDYSVLGTAVTGTYTESGVNVTPNMFTVKTQAGLTIKTSADSVEITKGGSGVAKITDVGTYEVTVKYEDKDYKAVKTFTVTVNPKSISGATVSLNQNEFTYSASSVKPEVTAVSGITSNDYDVTSNEEKTVVGEYTVTVTGKGNYEGTAFATWKIVPAEITISSVVVNSKTYDGATTATVGNVVFGGLKGSDALALGTDYTVNAEFDNKNAGNEVPASGTVALRDTSVAKNYTLASDAFNTTGVINKANGTQPIAETVQTLLSSSVVTGSKDYTFNLGNIISEIPQDAGDVTYTVKTEGAYLCKTGTGIEGSNLKLTVATPQTAGVTDSVVVTVTTTNYVDKDVTINFEFKNKITVTVAMDNKTVTYGDGYEMTGVYQNQPATGYTWTYSYVGDNYSSNVPPTNPGTYTVTASYEDNTPEGDIPGHIGETTATLVINKKTLTVADGNVQITKVYDNTTTAGTLTGELALTGKVGSDDVSVNMVTATVGAYGAENVGTYTVAIENITLTGADSDKYLVAPTYNFANAKITKQIQSAIAINGTNDNITRDFALDTINFTLSGGNGFGAYNLVSSDNTILNVTGDDVDWTGAIKKAGTVTITVTKAGDVNYENSTPVSITVTINPRTITDADFTFDLSDKVFANGAIEPSVTSALVRGTDFDVAYLNNINKGTATITVTGKVNYQGTVTKNFEILAKALNLTEFTVTGLADGYTYTGSAITPVFDVKWADLLLTGADYDVAYSDNVNAGTATITVTGKGNYTDSINAQFTITPAQYEGTVTITANESSIKVGTILTANATAGDVLSYQWKREGTVIEGATASTYTVATEDAGKDITVLVTSAGNVVGSVESASVSVGKIILSANVSITGDVTALALEITSAPSADNYDIVWLKDGVVIVGETGLTYTVKDEDKGSTISAKIVAKGESYTGEIASLNTFAIPATAPTFVTAPTISVWDKQLTVNFSAKPNGAAITGYQIYVNGSVVATVDGQQTRYVITGLNNGETYTIKVAAINAAGTTVSPEVSGTPQLISTGGSAPSYEISVQKAENGSISTLSMSKAGNSVSVNVTPKDGYALSAFNVTSKNGKIEVTKRNDTRYTFIMPASAVTVFAEFIKVETPDDDNEKPVDPDEKDPVEDPVDGNKEFADVSADSYYYDAVKWAATNNVTSGTSETSFSPESECTRAQIVTFLWRAAGSPNAENKEHSFKDIDENSYYYDAVIWAIENSITSGVSATEFAPDSKVSRAQVVTFMWRAEKSPLTNDMSAFGDVDADDYFAQAVNWAVENGVTQGISATEFAPDMICTRAQIVTFLYRHFAK